MADRIESGRVFVSKLLSTGQAPEDSLTIVLRLPSQMGKPDSFFVRPQSETLQAQLTRIASKLAPKAAKGKKQKNSGTEAPAQPSLRLVDADECELPLDAPCVQSWPFAQALLVDALPDATGTLRLEVHWDPPDAAFSRVPADAPVVGVPLVAEASFIRCTSDDCEWVWQSAVLAEGLGDKSIAKSEWVNVGRGIVYIPAASDEGRCLRVCCQPPFPGELACTVASKQAVKAAADDSARWTSYPCTPASPAFRVATYNVLADAYAGQKWHMENLFWYCAPGVVPAPRRRQLIVRDILKIDADLIGLQEVDAGQLTAMAILGNLGWDHSYTRKAGMAADGCALFWRRIRFQPESSPFDFRLGGNLDDLCNRLQPEVLAAIRGHGPTKDVLAAVTTIAQGVILRDLAMDGRRVLVANTHLYYHPEANHIRLLQLHMLLTELKRRAIIAEADGHGPVAVVLVGDLNARKGNFGLSDVGKPPQAAYRLVSEGTIFADDVDWDGSSWTPDEWRSDKNKTTGHEGVGSENNDRDKKSPSVCICCNDVGVVLCIGTCPLCDGLGSAAWDADLESRCGEDVSIDSLRLELSLPLPLIDPNRHLEVTNFTSTFQECLDYTLLDSRMLRGLHEHGIAPPPLDLLRAETALPSTLFPSDHVPVVVDVVYIDG